MFCKHVRENGLVCVEKLHDVSTGFGAIEPKAMSTVTMYGYLDDQTCIHRRSVAKTPDGQTLKTK